MGHFTETLPAITSDQDTRYAEAVIRSGCLSVLLRWISDGKTATFGSREWTRQSPRPTAHEVASLVSTTAGKSQSRPGRIFS